MEKLPQFLKREKDSILFNGDGEFFFYVPEKFFDLNIATYIGANINILGVLNYAIKYKDGKMSDLKTFDYPTRFLTHPYKVDKIKNTKIIKESKAMDYRILTYRKGDAIIIDTSVPQSLQNVEDFIKLFVINGHIPNTIPYDKLQSYFIDNITYNGSNYGVALQLFGIIVSELCRSNKDINTPFRLSRDTDMKDYNAISVDSVAKLISPYSAINSDNFNESMVYACMNNKKVQIPLERVLTGEDIT